MNKHFEDARYYLKRAGETAGKGLKEELEPVEARFRELTGKEEEPEPNRLEAVKADLKALQERAEGEAEHDALGRPLVDVRQQFGGDGGDDDSGREVLHVALHLWARRTVDGDHATDEGGHDGERCVRQRLHKHHMRSCRPKREESDRSTAGD